MSLALLVVGPLASAEVVSKAGAPMLELISMLQHQHQNRMDVHHQEHDRRRHLQSEPEAMDSGALTRENTKPIRIKLDVNSLYEDKAPDYSACFELGAWFRRGLPAQRTPPSNGVETCVRGTGESLSHNGCWGRCKDYDLITAADRTTLIQVASALVSDLPAYFALRPVDNLKFAVSKGAYERALRSKGYPTPEACATDCTTLSRVAVDPRYCEETGGLAIGYDAVLSITVSSTAARLHRRTLAPPHASRCSHSHCLRPPLAARRSLRASLASPVLAPPAPPTKRAARCGWWSHGTSPSSAWRAYQWATRSRSTAASSGMRRCTAWASSTPFSTMRGTRAGSASD